MENYMRARPSVAAALAIVGLAVFTVWITWRAKVLENIPNAQSTALLNKPAPNFKLTALDGRTISLADYRGKEKVVLSFWASWCGPCRRELPVLRSFYQRTHRPGADYDILAINLDDDRESAQQATNEGKLPFPVLLDPDQKIADAYGVNGIPALFIVDKTGRVSYANAGFNMTLEFTLATKLGIDPKTVTSGEPSGAAGH
jgi:peroxiredoxin